MSAELERLNAAPPSARATAKPGRRVPGYVCPVCRGPVSVEHTNGWPQSWWFACKTHGEVDPVPEPERQP